MSHQRLRGEVIYLWEQKKIEDRRGLEKYAPDPDRRIETRCSESFDRSANAEAPGQVVTDIISVRVGPEAEAIGSRGTAYYRGSWWDIIGPKAHRRGTRRTRHYTLLLTLRPNAPEGLEVPNG